MDWKDLGIELKNHGNGKHYTTCPQCSHTRTKKNVPCLTVNVEPNNNWFHCNHCSFEGNLEVLTLRQEKSNKLYQKARIPKVLPEVYSKPVMDFLKKRGISPGIIQAKGVFEINLFHEPVPTLAIPYKRQGVLFNVKYRRLDYDRMITYPDGSEKYLAKNFNMSLDDGAEYIYYGLNDLNPEYKDLIICEGEIDRWTWLESMIEANVLSVPNGAPNVNDKDIEKKMAFARDSWVINNVYNKHDRVFLSTDDDGPGKRLCEELAAIIGKDKCYIIKYGGRKDINEVHAGAGEHPPMGISGVIKCFESAEPYPVRGIITIDSALDKLMMLAEKKEQKGFTIGDVIVDKYISIQPPLMMVTTGIPGQGKTSWWRWYAAKQAMKNNLKFAAFPPDSRPVEREYARLAEIYVGKRWEKNKPWSMSEQQRTRAIDWIRDHFIIVNPDEKNHELLKALNGNKVGEKTWDSLFWYFENLKKKHGIFGYWIDAYNKVEHQKPKDMTDEAYIGKNLDMIIKFNTNFDLFSNIIAHPTKLERKDPNYFPPDLYNIKGSSAWFERTDIGATIYRKKYEKVRCGGTDKKPEYKWERNNQFPTDIIITKQKFSELGEEGDFSMFMDWIRGEIFVHERPKYYDNVHKGSARPEDIKTDQPISKLLDKVEEAVSGSKSDEDILIDDLPF